MSDPYFATGYVRLLYRFMRARGVSADQLFLDTDFCETELMQADVEMPFAAQMRITQNALAQAGKDLGLQVGYQLQLAAHGPLGTAMQSAPELKTALATFAKFIAVRASFFSLSVSVVDKNAHVSIEIRNLPEDLIPFFSESILFTLTHCLTFYTGQRVGVSKIRLGYPDPGYGDSYKSVFGGPIEFDCATTQILFERALLSLPSPETDAVAFTDSVKRCQDLIDQRTTDGDVLRSIESFLLENPGKLWTVEEIAPLFAMSSRTLIRKLKESGTTYQALRDEVLKRQAAIYLVSMNVESAAMSLGFADTSSFRRTFKRWYGITPTAFLARG